MKLLASVCLLSAIAAAGEIKIGKAPVVKDPVPVSTVLAKPAPYVGKTVQVKGKVTAVCQMMGCWMTITGTDGKSVRLKVNDGEMVFPKDAAGKTAIAEGTLNKIEMTREEAIAQAKHEAEESGRKFDAASAKVATTYYEMKPTGVVLLD